MRDLRPLALRLATDRRSRQLGAAGFHNESVREQVPRSLHVWRGRRLVLVPDVVADEMAGDAELHVGLQELVVLHVDLRDQRLEAVLAGEEVQVRRPHVVPALGAQEIAGRAIDRDRIAGRLHAAKTDVAFSVGEELAAQVHVGLHRVLVLVEAFRRRMPDVDLGAGDRIAFAVAEPGVDEHHRPRRRRAHDRAAVRRRRRMHTPERPEHVLVGLGGAAVAVVDEADQRGEAERSRHQRGLVVRLAAVLADRHHVGEGGLEFFFRQLHLAHEVVQMPHEGGHDLAEARIARALQFREDRGGDVLLGLDDHAICSVVSIDDDTRKSLSGSMISDRSRGSGAVGLGPQAIGAQTILARCGLRHGQPEALCGAPAFAAQPAIERGAAAGAEQAAR